LYKELFFLATGLNFGYGDLMEMEHTERLKWCKMLIKHAEKR